MKKYRILFVCRHNRFRSKVAEAIFRKLNKNKNILVRSRGIILSPDVIGGIVKILKEKGYRLHDRKSRVVREEEIKKSDLIVIVADNVSKDIFNQCRGRIIRWKIRDCDQRELKKIEKTIDKIESRVRKLIKNIQVSDS